MVLLSLVGLILVENPLTYPQNVQKCIENVENSFELSFYQKGIT